MSAHVLLNLLNELGENDKHARLSRVSYRFPPTGFNKFNYTGARLQESIYHMALKSHCISLFCIKPSRFRH